MRLSLHFALTAALLAACSSSSNEASDHDSGTSSSEKTSSGSSKSESSTSGTTTGKGDSGTTSGKGDSGSTTGKGDSGGGSSSHGDTDAGRPDSGHTGGTCGSATLFAGNPNFADPANRPSDGDNILTGTPYLYQQLLFTTGGQILTNDQLSVWRIDTSDSELHAVAGGPLTGNAQLLAGAAPAGLACGMARFADLLGSAMDSHGDVFVADYANAILKVSNPLDATTCNVSYFAGTAVPVPTPMLDQTDGNSGTADGTGSAAQFEGPQYLTIDASDNLYVLDHETAWSIRKITPAAVVSTIATFSDNQYAFGELQYLNGKVWFWAFGNDASDAAIAALIPIDPAVTSPVVNPPPTLTLHGADLGGDSSEDFDVGGVTTDGTKLYVVALGQLFSINVSGATPVLSSPLAGENDDNWSAQTDLDFASGYDPTATQTAATLELLELDEVQTRGVDSDLSRDSAGNIYFVAESNDVYIEKIAGCP